MKLSDEISHQPLFELEDKTKVQWSRKAKEMETESAAKDSVIDAMLKNANQLRDETDRLKQKYADPREILRLQGEVDRLRKIVDRIVTSYRKRPVEIAVVCDEVIDRSGNLLGWLREEALTGGNGDGV